MQSEDVILLELIEKIKANPHAGMAPASRPRSLKMLTLNGMTMALRAWAAHAGLSSEVLHKRLQRGMNLADALTKPARETNPGDPVWMILKAMKAKPCTDCKNTYHNDAMEFDHVRGEKKYDISKIKSRKALMEELAKCELVCANCHRIRTANRRRGRSRETYAPA